MSDTPRTDALLKGQENYSEFDAIEIIDFARRLERELAEAKAEVVRADYATRRAVERIAELERRWQWVEALFDGKWNGTIGRPKDWNLRGDWRHIVQPLNGNTLAEAIDAARAKE